MASTKSKARFVIMPPSFSLAETHVSRTLARGKGPIVAIARVENGELAFIPKQGLGKGDIAALVAEAQAHLDAQTTKWSIEMSKGIFGLFKRPVLASATGGLDEELLGLPKGEPRYGLTMKIAGVIVADDYAPERVLSPKALMGAHEGLGAESLIAILPKRGMLLLAPGIPGELPAMMRINQMAQEICGGAGAAGICDHGFFVKNGQLIGVCGNTYVSLFPSDIAPWSDRW